MTLHVLARSARAGGGLTAGFYLLTLAIAFLATAEVRVRAGGMPSFTLLELVSYPVALCLVVEALLRPALADELVCLYRSNRPLAWYAGYAGLAALLGLSRTSDTLQSFKDLPPSLLLCALVFLTVTSHWRLMGLLAASLAGVLLNVLLGLSQIAVGGPYPIARSVYIEQKLDLAGDVATQVANGFFSHPNGLAVFLLPAMVFLVVATWPGFGRSRALRIDMLAVLAVTALVFEMTFAKGAFAWLAAALLFLALPARLDRWRPPIAAATVVIGIAILVWLSIRALIDGEGQYGTMAGRMVLWLAALDVIRSDGFVTLFGSGASLVAGQDLSYANAHNAWINQALTYGVPALLFHLAAFWVAFRTLGRAIVSRHPPERTVALATMAALLAVLGESFFEAMDGGVVFKAQLFTLFGIAALFAPRSSSRSTPAQETR